MPLTLAHISYALLGRNAAVPKRTRELMEMQGMSEHAVAALARAVGGFCDLSSGYCECPECMPSRAVCVTVPWQCSIRVINSSYQCVWSAEPRRRYNGLDRPFSCKLILLSTQSRPTTIATNNVTPEYRLAWCPPCVYTTLASSLSSNTSPECSEFHNAIHICPSLSLRSQNHTV